MFAIGDYVVYGTSGVYLIEDCRIMDFDRISIKDRKEYFILKPLRENISLAYVPLDAAEQRLRPVTDKEILLSSMEALKGKKIRWVDDRKRRNQIFRTILSEKNSGKMMTLLSCLYRKQSQLHADGKKLSFADSDVITQAEGCVGSEIAFTLSIPYNDAVTMLREALKPE